MSTPSLYSDGTISIENGSTAFTGASTAWSTQLKTGSQIHVGGVVGVVASIESDVAGTLQQPWAGDTATGATYLAETWSDGGEIATYVRTLMERLIGKGLGIVASGSLVAADYGANDLVYNRDTQVLAIKDAGVLKALLSPQSYDAYGNVTNSPSDRDQYDDGQGDLDAYRGPGLTFFSLTEGGFYVLRSVADAETETAAVWSDLVLIRGPSGEGDKYTVPISVNGKPRISEVLLRLEFETAVTFPEDFAGSRASADDAATGTAAFSVTKNGTEIGTLTFDEDDAGTFVLTGGASFDAGDILRIIAPATRDATLSDLSITLAGSRSN